MAQCYISVMVAVRDMPDSWDIPKQQELNMAEEKYGIQETKELLEFVFSLAEAIKKSNADGEFNWRDGLNFIEPLKRLGPAIDNIEGIVPEIGDLDAEEWAELVEFVSSRWDLDTGDADDDLSDRIEDGLNAGIELVRMTQLFKTQNNGRRDSECQAPSWTFSTRGWARGRQIDALLSKLDTTADRIVELTVEIKSLNSRQERHSKVDDEIRSELKLVHSRVGTVHDEIGNSERRVSDSIRKLEERVRAVEQYKSKLMGIAITVSAGVGRSGQYNGFTQFI